MKTPPGRSLPLWHLRMYTVLMRLFPSLDIEEFRVFGKLDTPSKVQDYLDKFPINFEKGGETYRSPLMTMRANKMHCMEGAMLAAAIFWYHGREPLIMNLLTTDDDVGHAVALFKERGHWGAVTKTNHAVLRYRDPVFRTTRELAMSYFNEYFKNSGTKTLRGYSRPFRMLARDDEWLTSRRHLWDIVHAIDDSYHYPVLPKGMERRLRPADRIEIQAGKLIEWKRG